MDRRSFIKYLSAAGASLTLQPLIFSDTQKTALFWKRSGKNVICTLCPNMCVIAPGEKGNCKARKNIDSTLISSVYNKPCIISSDHIEKCPLYHVEPGAKVFSIATAGCNLHCKYCQNWQFSQSSPENTTSFDLSASQLIQKLKKENITYISFFYTEPVVYYEYMLDIAQRAKKNGIRTICVTAGYINERPLLELAPLIDYFVFGLKGFNDRFYRKYIECSLKPVLRSLQCIHHTMKKWVEITYLLIPGHNDSSSEIRNMSDFLVKNNMQNVPLHFLRFIPEYQMKNLAFTPLNVIENAYNIAQERGMKFCYIDNLPGHAAGNTVCPSCGKVIVQRLGIKVMKNHICNGVCKFCNTKIPGHF